MKYTNRIRLYLVIVAMLPPMIIMAVIYFSSLKEAELSRQIIADNSIKKYIKFENYLFEKMEKEVLQIAQTNEFGFSNEKPISRNLDLYRLGFTSTYFDFVELIDSTKTVLASKNRPALIGEKLLQLKSINIANSIIRTKLIEFDRIGGHATYGLIFPLKNNLYMYAGQFLDKTIILQIQNITDSKVEIILDSSNDLFDQMEPLKLYENENSYLTVLCGSKKDNYYLIVRFNLIDEKPILQSLFVSVIVVSFFSILIAISIGIYITGKNKKEMENLVQATERIADGDFTTPVMAIEEGQYSQLADAFSDMIMRLKKLQHKLSTTEKIAAWQIIGRKIAHELKNPLTPISISIEDLRLAYAEKLPDFDKTFNETSETIKKEIARMKDLINEFVSFSRMKSSEPQPMKVHHLFDEIKSIYKNQIDSKKLRININQPDMILQLDLPSMKQVLINLIKNGFESGINSEVIINTDTEKNQFIIIVEDTGPGFSEEKLKNSFEPFVTTKTEGSGLGLVISHRIINDHNGILELYNEANGGGIVKITLPI